MSTPLRVTVAAITHQGKVRPHNEDAIAVGQWVRTRPMTRPEVVSYSFRAPVLCLVADGMGGHAAGEVASEHVAYRLADDASTAEDEEALAALLQRINHELFDQMERNKTRFGMGTTVAGVLIRPECVLVFNVGDSRVYLEQEGYLRQLSEDDTPRSISHSFDPTEASQAGREVNTLLQALGGAERRVEILPHVSRQPPSSGQRYLLCSDGLTDVVDLDIMEACLADEEAATVQALFERAMSNGGYDNISIAVIHIEVAQEVPVDGGQNEA